MGQIENLNRNETKVQTEKETASDKIEDEKYMRQAIELAKKGVGWVNPNPMVGAVIVKDGRVIGCGYHRKCGELHAERNAFADCKESAEGATLYVTLEPCCHTGKTPPCTEAVIENGITRVVVGSSDPNPLVAGGGIKVLREHGIEVETGVLKGECDAINPVFFHYIKTKRPYVTMKYAMTIDGKIATKTGASKWITGEEARKRVHFDRHKNMGIMVGIGTVLADDPSLDCRLTEQQLAQKITEFTGVDRIEQTERTEQGHIFCAKNPVRIICDSNLRTPLAAKVVTSARKQRTILATCCVDESKWKPYQDAGCEVLLVKAEAVLLNRKQKGLDLEDLMGQLGELGIDSIFLEGGATLNEAALRVGIVHKVQTYIAPKIFGGAGAKTPVAGFGINVPDDAFILKNTTIEKIGEDFLLESEVEACLPES